MSDPRRRPLLKVLLERASCRNFTDKKIPPRVLNLILEAGCHAATGGNLQPYSIINIKNKKTAARLAKLCDQDFIARAPVNLLFCIDWHRLMQWAKLERAPFTATDSFRHFWISFQDTVICSQSVGIAADAMGLGSVYIGTVLEFFPLLKRMFRLPWGVFPVVLLCLGYPRGKLVPRRKLGPAVIAHDERYHKLSARELRQAFAEKYPGFRLEPTRDRLKAYYQTARGAHGTEFARQALARIKEQGYINAVQRYFGLHYVADRMPLGNEKYMKLFKDFGFGWFEKFKPGRKK